MGPGAGFGVGDGGAADVGGAVVAAEGVGGVGDVEALGDAADDV